MALVEILLPAMGEGIIEATLISWLKNEGEAVSVDENIVEVATDKVNSEVPSNVDGILHKKLFGDNEVIEVGKPFAIISTEGEEPSTQVPSSEPEKKAVEKPKAEAKKEESKSKKSTPKPQNLNINTVSFSSSDRFYSPLVQNIAREENISKAELDGIVGTGKEGRVTKNDILAFLENRGGDTQNESTEKESAPVITEKNTTEQSNTSSPVQQTKEKAQPQIIDFGPNVEVKKMDRMRSLIAHHMLDSIQTAPHVCSFVEADMSNIFLWRNKVKKQFQEKYGEKLTYTPILIEAIAKAIKEFPMINSSLDGDNILIKKEVNIGMAAALPDGNLIVPVIKNADTLNLLGLAQKVNDLGARAKQNKLKPDEIQGGTYTMTNLGSFGNLFGTPIINQPQVAIMGVGAIVKKPVVIETEDGDTIGIKPMMYLSHSYDHRIVDGMMGGTFVKRVADILEDFDMNREI